MARNSIEDLNNHLFMTIELLIDGDAGMTTDKAKAIADCAQTLINGAKVQNEFLKLQGSDQVLTSPALFIPKQHKALEG